MIAIVQVCFLVALGMCATFVCCGALVLLSTLPRLVARQRAALWGVRS